MLVLIGSDYSFVALGIVRLSLLESYYLLQLLILLLLWLSFPWLIVLLLTLHNIDLTVLLGVLVLVFLLLLFMCSSLYLLLPVMLATFHALSFTCK